MEEELDIDHKLVEEDTMAKNRRDQGEQVQEQPRTIREYASPRKVGDLSCRRRPPINVANFKAKLITLTVLNNYQFRSLPRDDPNQILIISLMYVSW